MIPALETFGGTWPFSPRYFDGNGFRMHYIDEGDGDPDRLPAWRTHLGLSLPTFYPAAFRDAQGHRSRSHGLRQKRELHTAASIR